MRHDINQEKEEAGAAGRGHRGDRAKQEGDELTGNYDIINRKRPHLNKMKPKQHWNKPKRHKGECVNLEVKGESPKYVD